MLDNSTSLAVGTDGLSPSNKSPVTVKKKSRARKTSTKPTRIYSYRILPPEDSAHRKLVDDQFWLAHQYRCRLIEIENQLRSDFRAVDLDHHLTQEAAERWEAQSAGLDEIYKALRAAKSGRAPEHRDDEQIKLRLSVAKRTCALAWRAVKEARGLPEVKDHHAAQYQALRKRAAEQGLAARAEFSAQG